MSGDGDPSPSPRGGVIVIGDELLSGKVDDLNSIWLAKELRLLGARLERIAILPDDIDVIADHVRTFSEQFDFVITSGGVGPTHDDRTFEAVALAFGDTLAPRPELEEVIRRFFGDSLHEAHLQMAVVPTETELVQREGMAFPAARIRNVWVMPGSPEILRRKFTAIRDEFRGSPLVLRQIWMTLDESAVAGLMEQLDSENPDLAIGSYPEFSNTEYRTLITIESRDAVVADAAMESLLAAIPKEAVVRTD